MSKLNCAFESVMPATRHIPWWIVNAGLMFSAACALSACDNRNQTTEPTQVAARVNSQDISVHQIEAVLQSQPALLSQLGNQAADKVLHSLVEQELAAQAAKVANLDHSPKVLQSLELAKREVLARAYQDQLAARAVGPSSDEVDRYYESRPDLFAQRRRFTLQDTVVDVPADELKQLGARVQQMTKLDELEPALRDMGLRYSTRSQTRFAEELPIDLLPKIESLAAGHSVLIERSGGAEIFTLTYAESTPLGLMRARPIIRAFLLQERQRQLVEAGMKTLRDAAHIEYMNASKPATAEVTGASAASAP